ncbi:MAG: response regulator [Burkholderiaceae bacterium]
MVGYNILPIGFSSYEKSTIETFFRLAGRRAPHWALTTRSGEARVVLFNATSELDFANFRSLVASWQKVIIVGSSDFGTGWPVLPRPIKLTAILGLLDDVANFKTSDIMQPVPALLAPVIANPSMTDVFANITSQVAVTQRTAPKPAPQIEKIAKTVKQASIPLNEAPSFVDGSLKDALITSLIRTQRETSNAVLGRVLLVDDSDIALKYMQNRLRHFGYECELVHSGEEALALVATHNYQFVFLDVMMAGLDGYQTCKAIKNNKARRGPPPVVVMLTSKGGAIDKIRGSMAGCDAYLTKPLNDKKLAVVLTKYDDSTVTERWEAANPRQPLVDTYVPRSR